MTTPIRFIFGGSNRPHHLRMSASCATALATLSAVNPSVEALGYIWQMPHPGLWLVAAGACYGQEWWAGSDRDEQHKRLPQSERGWQERTMAERLENWYWWSFGYIPHRNVLSHGLVIGTVVRGVYGWWPVLLALWWLWEVSPFWAAWLGVAAGVGCFVNDLAHILLDL